MGRDIHTQLYQPTTHSYLTTISIVTLNSITSKSQEGGNLLFFPYLFFSVSLPTEHNTSSSQLLILSVTRKSVLKQKQPYTHIQGLSLQMQEENCGRTFNLLIVSVCKVSMISTQIDPHFNKCKIPTVISFYRQFSLFFIFQGIEKRKDPTYFIIPTCSKICKSVLDVGENIFVRHIR